MSLCFSFESIVSKMNARTKRKKKFDILCLCLRLTTTNQLKIDRKYPHTHTHTLKMLFKWLQATFSIPNIKIAWIEDIAWLYIGHTSKRNGMTLDFILLQIKINQQLISLSLPTDRENYNFHICRRISQTIPIFNMTTWKWNLYNFKLYRRKCDIVNSG